MAHAVKIAQKLLPLQWATELSDHGITVVAVTPGFLRSESVLQHFGVHRPRRGSVAAIFQPAEEIPFGATSGASVVLADEAMATMRPRAVLGVHCWPQLAAGAIGVESRIAMAAKASCCGTMALATSRYRPRWVRRRRGPASAPLPISMAMASSIWSTLRSESRQAS